MWLDLFTGAIKKMVKPALIRSVPSATVDIGGYQELTFTFNKYQLIYPIVGCQFYGAAQPNDGADIEFTITKGNHTETIHYQLSENKTLDPCLVIEAPCHLNVKMHNRSPAQVTGSLGVAIYVL